MSNQRSHFVVIGKVQGELVANVIKTHLESEGVHALLQYESVGRVYGISVDGLGEVKILVPEELVEKAKHIIGPGEFES